MSAASVSRWRTREREQGDARPKALGGDRKSHHIEVHVAREEALERAEAEDKKRLKEISAKGDDLERLNAIVDFEAFRADLARAVRSCP